MGHDFTGLSVGGGGWMRLVFEPDDVFIVARVLELAGRFRMDELYIDGPITGSLLRAIKPGEIEGMANHPRVATALRMVIDEPGIPMRMLASHYSTRWGSQRNPETGDLEDVPHWVAQAWYSQFDDWDGPVPPEAKPAGRVLGRRREAPEIQLRVPESKPYPDDFWEAVATAYMDALDADLSPGVAIAAAADRPPTTAHRWVREARRRGLLPEATPGRAG